MITLIYLMRIGLYYDGRTISQDFRNAVRDLVGVVTHADDGVGAQFLGMLHHQLECLLSGLLT